MSIFGNIKKLGLREKFVFVVSLAIISSMIIISGYLIKRQNEIYRQELANRLRIVIKWSEQLLDEIEKTSEGEMETIFEPTTGPAPGEDR